MSNNVLEDLMPFGVLSFFVIGIFFSVINFIMILWPKVEVFVDKKLIYTGSSLCVDVLSSGDTTTVKTSKFYCIFPDKFYTSKDVVIRTVE